MIEDAYTLKSIIDSGKIAIINKGYAQVDQMTYVDGTPMGKDRYYESSVLMDSINNWYPYAIVINPSN